MKMQLLAMALVFCLLPTTHCLFGVDVAMETAEPDDFCDEGPPGKYCLLDLSGWHDCHVDPTTGKMVDTIHSCAPNTRCACFYGPACPASLANPCQPYRLPPPPPDKFTLEYNSKQHTCTPMGCRDTYSSGREIQSLTEEKKRDDVYNTFLSIFVQRRNGSSYIQSTVRWEQTTCKYEFIKAFPETAIPSYFSYNGTVRLGYRMCEQWIWRTGGHNVGQGTSLTAYYITYQTNTKEHYPKVRGAYDVPYVPVMVEFFSNNGPPVKISSHDVINITSFVNGEADEKLLEVPSFCKT